MTLDKHPQTLADWREITVVGLGEDSPAVEFLDWKIAQQGELAIVATPWQQMILLLERIHKGEDDD